MTEGSAPRVVRIAVAVYRGILQGYPADFRRCCGGPMVETFRELCIARHQAGTAALIRTCAGEFASAIGGIWGSRRSVHPPSPVTRIGGGLWQDARYAVRRLRSQPGIALLTIVTLGLAIAATAAMFSIVDAVMLRPSPFQDPERLMLLANRSARTGATYPGLSREKLKQWRTERDLFDGVEAYRRTSVVVTGSVQPEEVPAAYVSAGLLPMLGLPPAEGRMFVTGEGSAGQEDVVVVSEAFWRSRLGGEAQGIGMRLTVNGRSHAVVGVMPRRFQFPTRREQIWIPFDPEAQSSGTGLTEVIVRINDGLPAALLPERVSAAVSRLQAERPLPTGWGIHLRPSTVSGPDETTRRGVLVLFGAVALVLLTACANVANLLLSRAIDRQREFAIRTMLGASRVRLFRELLVEGAVLGVLAGALGVFAARSAMSVLGRLAPAGLVEAAGSGVGVDARVLAFTIVIALATGVLCNIAPAFRLLGRRSGTAISGRTRSSTETPFQRRLRSGLVTLEVALAVVLLVGAALMVRSFIKLNAIDLGFDPDRLTAVTIGLDAERYPTDVERISLLRRVAADLQTLPGVASVVIAAGLPPEPGVAGLAALESDRGPCGAERTRVFANTVSPGYFSLMGIRLVAGRSFGPEEAGTPVVLSRGLARLCGGDTLVGRRLRLDSGAPWLHVVGIAGDVRTTGLLGDPEDLSVYLPLGADVHAALPMTATLIERRVVARRLVIRAERGIDLADRVKQVLWARDPDQPVLGVAPIEELMADTVRRERFMLTLMSLFSGVALALASAGIFGALAYSVAQRTPEIGIRMALGAPARSVLTLVVGQGLALITAGVVAGLIAAAALSRVLAGLLYEVDARDPVSFVVVPLLIFAVGLAASWIPTRRALGVDPATALRVE